MSPCKFVFSITLAFILLSAALAQNFQVPPPVVRGGGVHPRQEPCWAVAGISKATMDQVRTVRRQARLEIEGVCAKSSLSLEQKREQIRAIHERERQQVDALIPLQQREAMRACQKERAVGGHGPGGHPGRGPCGELPKAKERAADPNREE